MSLSKAESDDLEAIRGIGPDARKWLAATFDVRTFAALADLSEEELINRIKADNKPSVWKRWAKDWPTEAAIKAAEMEAEAEARQPALVSDRRNNGSLLASPGMESFSLKPNNPSGGKDGWDTLALYFIEFQSRQIPGKPVELQTKVVFEGPGPQAQETLPGIEQDRICQWIFEHAGGILRAMPAAEALPGAETMPPETGPSAISVSELRLFQPAGAGSPLFSYSSEQPKLSMIRADQPFDLKAILEESRPRTSANGRITFKVQFLVKNWDSTNYTILGNVEPEAIEEQLAYSALLPDISLQRGKYRLQVLALAHPKPVVLGSIEIPMLSVW
jgi:hypothetical protein